MAVLPICTAPNPILKQKAKRVRAIDGSINKLIDDMIETMHYLHGAGLAAPQVGVSLRVIVVDAGEAGDIVLINPEVVKSKGERTTEEACFSVPGYFAETSRAASVTAKGRDAAGKEIRIKAEGLLAQALEHEIDHLNGHLYIDHLESLDELRKIEAEETGM